MLKKTKIALSVVAGIAFAASAIGYWGGQYYVADKFRDTLSNSGYCMQTSEPTYSINNGRMAIASDCSDWNGNEWKVISVLKPDWERYGLYSQTKLIANDKDTVNTVGQLIDPKTKALKATGYGLHTFSTDHVEIEIEPFQFVSQQNSIVMPSSVIILDKERSSSMIDIVFAPVDDVTIDTLGGKTRIKTPRVMWNFNDQSRDTITFKCDDISVGKMSIAKNPIASVTQKKHDNILDISVNFKADTVTTNEDVELKLNLSNLEPDASVSLFKSSTALMQEATDKSKQRLITDSLENIFELAKHNANAKLSIKANEFKLEKTDISIDAKFEKDSMNRITSENVFSLLESLIVEAKVQLPTDVAVMIIDPIWLQNFISDGLIKNRKGQLSTEIHFRDMTAHINGKTLNL